MERGNDSPDKNKNIISKLTSYTIFKMINEYYDCLLIIKRQTDHDFM